MKNATKHADNLKSLYKKLLKEGKPDDRAPIDPLRAMVIGTLSFDASDNRVKDAMAVIDEVFVDLNELRVATELELVEMLGSKYPGIEHRAMMMREMLNAIFEKEHTLSFERIKTLGKKEVRAFLRDLPEMTPFVEAYTLLVGFEESAVPVDEMMLNVLREHAAIEDDTTLADAQRFVESHVKADEQFSFFQVTRRAALAARKK